MMPHYNSHLYSLARFCAPFRRRLVALTAASVSAALIATALLPAIPEDDEDEDLDEEEDSVFGGSQAILWSALTIVALIPWVTGLSWVAAGVLAPSGRSTRYFAFAAAYSLPLLLGGTVEDMPLAFAAGVVCAAHIQLERKKRADALAVIKSRGAGGARPGPTLPPSPPPAVAAPPAGPASVAPARSASDSEAEWQARVQEYEAAQLRLFDEKLEAREGRGGRPSAEADDASTKGAGGS